LARNSPMLCGVLTMQQLQINRQRLERIDDGQQRREGAGK
jgi:hypothetical protein